MEWLSSNYVILQVSVDPNPYPYYEITDPLANWIYWNLPLILLSVCVFFAFTILYKQIRRAKEQNIQN